MKNMSNDEEVKLFFLYYGRLCGDFKKFLKNSRYIITSIQIQYSKYKGFWLAETMG